MDLTERQWRLIAPLLPKPKFHRDGRGRSWRDPRDVMNGVLWIRRTGAPWYDLLPRYPPYQTFHRTAAVTDLHLKHCRAVPRFPGSRSKGARGLQVPVRGSHGLSHSL